MTRKFEYTILDMIESAARTVKTSPLNLGGVSGVGGGVGGPPGGFIGQLPQTRVSYDETEAATLDTPASGMSILDNLNHIRYRLEVIESGGGGISGSGVIVVDDNTPATYDPTTTIHFSGAGVSVIDLGGGEVQVLITSSGGGFGANEFHIDQTGGTSDTFGTITGTLNGVNTDFIVAAGEYNSGTLSVYLNGQLLTQGTAEDWIEISGGAGGIFQFLTPPETTDEVTVIYQVSNTAAGNADTVDGYHASSFATSGHSHSDIIVNEVTAASNTGTIESTDLFATVKAGVLYKRTWTNILSILDTIFAQESAFVNHVTDTDDAHDASAISIADAGGYFTGTNTEAALQELGGGNIGWLSVTETWTRTGNHTYTVSGDLTARYRKGAKVKYNDGAVDYGVVNSSSHAGGTTTINLIPNTDYAMAAATITDTYLSYIEDPQGFPTQFNYTPTHSRTGTNYTNAPTTISASWTALGQNKLKYSIVWQQHGTPGGTGNQQFTIPVTTATGSVLLGTAYNASTNVMQMPQVVSATNLCIVSNYAGAVEVTASQFYVCSGIVDF